MRPENLLMVADSEHDANMLYAVGFFMPEPFIYLRLNGKSHLVLNDLEMERGRKLARHCRIISLSHCQRQLRRQGVASPQLAQVIGLILCRHGLNKISVPLNFPHGLAQELQVMKIEVQAKADSFFAAREIKSTAEVKKISAALIMAEVGLSEGIQVLKAAKAGKDGRLSYHDVPLTADKLRAVVQVAILQAGGLAHRTIVASGKQACDPHELGHGILRANQPIILDILPRSQKTGYYGDITRTIVKGRASEAVRKLYDTVARAQAVAFSRLRPWVPAVEVHQAVEEFFKSQGYRTSKKDHRMQGFFHGTGHGLGLEIHEAPRLSAGTNDVLKSGQVVTVEPGLYYPELGGVRLEDVAWISPKGPCNLTEFEKILEV